MYSKVLVKYADVHESQPRPHYRNGQDPDRWLEMTDGGQAGGVVEHYRSEARSEKGLGCLILRVSFVKVSAQGSSIMPWA